MLCSTVVSYDSVDVFYVDAFRDAHVVALVHALIIIPLSFNALNIEALVENKGFGWDPRAGNAIGVACG